MIEIVSILIVLLFIGLGIGIALEQRGKRPTPEMRAEWAAQREWQAKRHAFALEVIRVREILDASSDGSDEQSRAIELLKGLGISHQQWGYIVKRAEPNKPKLKQVALNMQLAIAEGTVKPSEFSDD